MNDCINMTAHAYTSDKLCLWDTLYKKRATSFPLPFTISGFCTTGKKKTESKMEKGAIAMAVVVHV